MHAFKNGTDLVGTLNELAALGSMIHTADWKQICVQCASAARELEKLRRQRDDLLSHVKGISRQTAEMVKAYTD